MTSVDTASCDPVDLLKQLIEIPSVNPDVDAAGGGESAIADFIHDWFTQRGFYVERLESKPRRPSIVAIARGTGGGKTLMFNGHVDTVGVADYNGSGFLAKEAVGRIYGRGSCEMKAGVAAMMVAADNIRRRGVAGDVIVACVADQEGSAWGTQEVLKSYSADGAIVPEPSDLELTVCHKGLMWFDVVVKGKSAHGSRPDLGIDAISKSGKFLVALDDYSADLSARPPHPILGHGSAHASFIEGGTEISTYPGECKITIERRVVPGETRQTVIAEIADMIAEIKRDDAAFEADVTCLDAKAAFEESPHSSIATSVIRAATDCLGKSPRLRGEAFWLDTALLQEAGIPSVIIGVKGEGVHDSEEWVETESVRQLTTILTTAGLDFCSVSENRTSPPIMRAEEKDALQAL